MSNKHSLTIVDKCHTTAEQHPMMGKNGYTKIQWQCADGESYALLLPGGVFQGYTDAFALLVNGPGWVPKKPLELEPKVNTIIKNYIYDNDGKNCPGKADPPDITIQS
jgi:hypothetical protein